MADESYDKMPLAQLKKILKQEKEKAKQNKEKLIRDIKKLKKFNQKMSKVSSKLNKTPKPKKKIKTKKKKLNYDEYFEECIRNKKIPKDAPPYLRKAIERAIRERDQGLMREKSALEGFANLYKIKGEPGLLPLQFFSKNKELLKEFFSNHRNIKFTMVLVCMMEHRSGGFKMEVIQEDKAYFHSETYINLKSTDVKKVVTDAIRDIIQKLNIYQLNGSGWYFKEVLYLEIHTYQFNPIKGTSYIPLPDWLMRKKAIISIRNKDNKCFLWSILRYLHPKQKYGGNLKDLRPYENELKIPKGFKFPVKVVDINKFENANPKLPGINVFSVDYKKVIYPLRMASRDPSKTIDLFLYEENGKCHYSLIKNFSRLIRSQKTKCSSYPLKICKRCFNHFTSELKLQKHINYCMNNEVAVAKMPKEGEDSILRYKNTHKQFPLPFVAYADFECFTKPMSSCSPNPEDSYNYNYQKHEPSGFCLYFKGIVETKFEPILYTKRDEAENLAKIFVKKLVIATHNIYNEYYRRPKKIRLTKDEHISFCSSKICHICNEEIKEGDRKVRDHCHFTGKYRGAAHNRCNLKARKPLLLPVIFHNLQGYDAHLFIKELAALRGDFSCIPSTEKKYISFSKEFKFDEFICPKNGRMRSLKFEIRFIDSFKFLQTSLTNLVSNLQPQDFINTRDIFKENTDLITRKGVFPYDYVSSIHKLDEKHLPSKEEFYSKLNDEHISDEDYQHALNVFYTFNCKSIRDYHDLYLKSDVLLLSDVFENFRKTCLKHYKLDPAHYYTSPGLAWDACLKETQQQLELLTDYDMLMMVEKGIRGGISHISKRYAEANNKYMKDYNQDKESVYIQYLDANNLYGWAMSQPLPTHGFKWMKSLTKEKVLNILEKQDQYSSRGSLFEVDLLYPRDLWKLHDDYPLAPEKKKVKNVEKLFCDFIPKKNYVVHYQNLKQYLKMGIEITAVHRGISFFQSAWMEPYIRKNTELRKKAANSFEKDFFKLMNNSVFGKTIENIRKRQNIELVDNCKKALKLVTQPNFQRATIFDKNFIAVHMKRPEVKFDKPVYVGQAILDLSKTLMFDFHYNYIKKKYKNKAELLFTDTDSLMYEIRTEDFYKDISQDIETKFDTSDYPKDHPSGILTGVNKKVIGMFKDEVAGNQLTHFVGLRPKLYCFKIEGDKTTKKCKGMKKNVVKKGIQFEDYVKCLFSGEKQMRKMNIIRSENHDIYSKEVNKIALSNEDDKRKILRDQVHTRALRPPSKLV